MIQIKSGVQIENLTTPMMLGIKICHDVYKLYTNSPMVITSGTEGYHQKNSLHPFGNAVDLRLPSSYHSVIDTHEGLVTSMSNFLGEAFDVVLEHDHIHVEYDPQRELKPPYAVEV